MFSWQAKFSLFKWDSSSVLRRAAIFTADIDAQGVYSGAFYRFMHTWSGVFRNVNPCDAGTVFIPLKVRFKPNKLSLKLTKQLKRQIIICNLNFHPRQVGGNYSYLYDFNQNKFSLKNKLRMTIVVLSGVKVNPSSVELTCKKHRNQRVFFNMKSS